MSSSLKNSYLQNECPNFWLISARPLDEIAELLRLEDGTHCEEASGLAEHKLKDVREKMADLARMEAVLSELVCACHARKGNVSCPLIASLQDGTKLAASARGSHGVTTP